MPLVDDAVPLLPRLHVWAPVAFAHLRAHRCGVLVNPRLGTIEAFCPEPPIYRAAIRPIAPHASPLTALCAGHGEQARAWPTVVELVTFRELDTGEG